MIDINMLDVAKATGGILIGDSNAFVKGVSIDSRKIDASNLYIPIVGQNHDGHDYIEEVVNKNVSCFLVQKDHPRPNIINVTYIVVDDTLKALQDLAHYYIQIINPYVIGITGSNGKTSSKDMLCAIMSKKYKTAKTTGNHNNEIGVPLSILEFDKDIECAVIEMGVEYEGDINELCKIVKPNVSLITCIGSAHIANFETGKDGIADAKLEIYTNLPKGGYMFYNKESKEIEEGLEFVSDSSKYSYAYGKGSNLRIVDDIVYEDGYSIFKCSAFDDPISIKTLGRHQAMNALGCIGIGLKEGIPKEDIIDALKNLSFEKMRCDIVPFGKALIIDDTYKSNPESVHAALDILDEFKDYKKIVCLSDMLDLGDRGIKYHKEIGSYIRNNTDVDELICTGDLSYYTAKKAGGVWYSTKEECINYLKYYNGIKAVILIKGSRATGMDKIVEALKGKQ